MEPAEATLMRTAFFTKVITIGLRDGQWFVHFEGSHESVCFGSDKPDLKVGDEVKVTFERTTPNVIPSEAPKQ